MTETQDESVLQKVERLSFQAGLFQGALLGAGKAKTENKLRNHPVFQKLKRCWQQINTQSHGTVLIFASVVADNITLDDLTEIVNLIEKGE